MLQMMTKKVEAEGEREKELFEKFMCYCKTSGGELSASIGAAEKKIPELGADIEEAESQLATLKSDIKQAQADRTSAKKAMADATSLREKEAAAFAGEKSESDTNLAALAKAIAALEKGMAGAFLQTAAAQALQKIVLALQNVEESDRSEVLAFLSGKETYAPQGGEIVGILKQLHDEMSKSLADATADEEAAIKSYEELMAAKTKEVNALSAAIEAKLARSGDLAVQIAGMKNDLSDTEEALLEDKKFQADLQKNCATKESEWDEICKTRSEELVALAETIKILNDDDALELFKKTLPGSSASFLQFQEARKMMRTKASEFITRAQSFTKRPQLDLISLALQGKKIGFGKVIKMIDDMVALLGREQTDDDNKKEFCNTQLDTTDDKRKQEERAIADAETVIADTQESIAQLRSDIKALTDGIAALDKSVTEATENRKEEHAAFQELMAQDSAAKEVLGFAKNRLNKFYNPKLYKAPPKRVLSEEERITANMGGTLEPTAAPGGIAGTGVTVFAQIKAHEVQPEAPGAYKTKSQESNGVIAMIDMLVADLDKEMAEAKTAETNGQAEYEADMRDAAETRRSDSKALTDKQAALAAAEGDLQSAKDDHSAHTKELMAVLSTIESLHGECDWLLKYFDVRKEARAGEVDALNNAKAVLSGADFA